MPLGFGNIRQLTKQAEQLFEEVMKLEPPDLAAFKDRLGIGWEPDDSLEYVAAWEAEIGERIRQVETGEEKPIPWQTAMEQIRRGESDDE